MGLFDFFKKKELEEISRLQNLLEIKERSIVSLQDHIERLSKYQAILNAEDKAAEIIAIANKDASAIVKRANEEAEIIKEKAEEIIRSANIYKDEASASAKSVLREATEKAKLLKEKAEQIINTATSQSGIIIENAHKKAQEIAGEAYKIKMESTDLEKTLIALRNTVKGYGDDYLIPSYSFLDQLADDFGYTEAGEELKKARERTRIIIRNKLAAKCDYVEEYRRTTAIDFTLDAFNGKVDSVLTGVKENNYGILKQKIVDAYYLVNHLGKAFRNAVITSQYLDARLDELKWAVTCTELKNQEREEQKRIRELIREEEKARREYEKAIRDAEKEEEIIKKAIEKARLAVSKANEEQKLIYETKLEELTAKLREAEEKNQRALSMAQQTKSGHVYIISNIGSFGENVYKIGMTRRLEPTDRVKELGDASVPFAFDIHAMIYSDNAPELETALHKFFISDQVNKVNPRKEFFKVPLSDIRNQIDSMNVHAKWTMVADAYEWRETIKIEKSIKEDPLAKKEWENRIISEVNEAMNEEDELIDSDGDGNINSKRITHGIL